MSEQDQTLQPTSRDRRLVTLTKQEHRFIFEYEAGDELKLLDTLVEMVKRKDPAFDWFDAAVVAHQVGEKIAAELKEHLPKKAA